MINDSRTRRNPSHLAKQHEPDLSISSPDDSDDDDTRTSVDLCEVQSSPPPCSYRARNRRVMITRSRFTALHESALFRVVVVNLSPTPPTLQSPFCNADTPTQQPCQCADRDVHQKSFTGGCTAASPSGSSHADSLTRRLASNGQRSITYTVQYPHLYPKRILAIKVS
jgi:hypothetical protein